MGIYLKITISSIVLVLFLFIGMVGGSSKSDNSSGSNSSELKTNSEIK